MTNAGPTTRWDRNVRGVAVVDNDLSDQHVSGLNAARQAYSHSCDGGARVGQRTRAYERNARRRGRSCRRSGRPGPDWRRAEINQNVVLHRIGKDVEIDRSPSGGLIVAGPGVEASHSVIAVVPAGDVMKTSGGVLSVGERIDDRIKVAEPIVVGHLTDDGGESRPQRSPHAGSADTTC